MKSFKVVVVVGLFAMACFGNISANEQEGGVSGDAALQKLEEGNKRYKEAKLTHPDQTKERREEVAKGQHPFAVIVSCSDSRVPPVCVLSELCEKFCLCFFYLH
ncbi:MAG: hypothetical protein HY934_06320 [Candidatus Firestonebacteria bacterium]|nr:hypothetical protein [Candidatus Firestonebacteria bacterium]